MPGVGRRRFCAGWGAAALALGCPAWRSGHKSGAGLLVRGAQVYVEGRLQELDIRAAGGVIVELGRGLAPQGGEQVVDAAGLLALPGGIDPHVHLSASADPPGMEDDYCDNYTHGSRAALAGGVTTIGVMVFPKGEVGAGILPSVQQHSRSIASQSMVDVMLHPVSFTADSDAFAALEPLVRQGHTSLKIFAVVENFERDEAAFTELIRAAGAEKMLTLLHCERHGINKAETARLVAAGKGGLRHYAESSPVRSEVEAVRAAIRISEETGSPIYVVHLSSAAALEQCAAARQRGVRIYVETRPMYLYHTRSVYERSDGPLFIGQPPLREEADIAALWEGLRSGLIDTIGSDHAPFTTAVKLDSSATIEKYNAGTPGLQMMQPMLYSEGVGKGRLSLDRFVALTSTNAARLFGLYPRKGALLVGSDADISLWDPNLRQTIRPSMIRSQAGYDINTGREVQGWPVTVIRRGEVAFLDDQVVAAPGSGELLARGPHEPLT